jgi:hypothetical protein
VRIRVRVDERTGGGTRLVVEATFTSSNDMDRLILMGFEEGLSSAIGQSDDVLRTDPSPHEPRTT